MTPDYVIPMCPGADPGADWQQMGWCCHACAAAAHVAWCPNHPGYWTSGPAVMWEIFLQQLDPDEPVPLILTPKGRAALDTPIVDGDATGPLWHAECDSPICPACGGCLCENGIWGCGHGAPVPVEAVPLVDGPGPADEWACESCGFGWFGTPPDDGVCDDCRTGG